MAESYKFKRRKAYLEKWPLTAQMEAMQDKEAGDSAKWTQMLDDFAAIRTQYPSPE